jgi:hypothetical protein
MTRYEKWVSVLTLGIVFLCGAPASSAGVPPDFSPNPQVSWLAAPGGLKSPPIGPGPLRDDPKHPTISNDDFRLTGKQPTFPVADLNNPILQPWVRDIVRKHNEQVIAGKGGYGGRQSCWPVGPTIFLTVPVFRPIFIVQSPKEVVMTWQLDAQSRHIHLNVPHSANPKPSWFGESVGHYEGETLVVDTIGLNDKTPIDDYLTPHTDKLHVVERFRMTNGGNTLEVKVHVEDPGAFTTPWDAVQTFQRLEPGVADNKMAVANDPTTGRSPAGPLQEENCAEGIMFTFANDGIPIPTAGKPDF